MIHRKTELMRIKHQMLRELMLVPMINHIEYRLCKCGCGMMIRKKYHGCRKGERQFAKSHNLIGKKKDRYVIEKQVAKQRGNNKGRTGQHLTQEHKKKIGAANKVIQSKPEYVEKSRIKRLYQIFPVKDSKPEKMIQIALALRGIKFEKHKPLIGQPDIFIEPNICVFIDGCYWHGCKLCFGDIMQDIQVRRIETDKKKNESLIEGNMRVIRIWEHVIMNTDVNELVQKLESFELVPITVY